MVGEKSCYFACWLSTHISKTETETGKINAHTHTAALIRSSHSLTRILGTLKIFVVGRDGQRDTGKVNEELE